MRQLIAFTKKEYLELWRNGRLTLFGILFLLFGIMNPALAKLTPWLMEQMADTLSEQGMQITSVTVDAMSSWAQFYKNAPMELLIFVVLSSGILTGEYQKGTLIHMLTKGLGRHTVLWAKGLALLGTWTLGYWLCFGVTCAYTAYFWDQSVLTHIGLGAALVYLAGVVLISLILLFSVVLSTGTAVMGAVLGLAAVSYLLAVLPKAAEYLPTYLLSAGGLLSGAMEPSDFLPAVLVSLGITFTSVAAGTVLFRKKTI